MKRVKNKIIKKREGFTLVELSLSLIFIGVLSLTIALIINDSIAVYRRGLTLNQINTVGMDLVDDIRSAFQNSTSKSVKSECESLYGEVIGGVVDESGIRRKCEEDNGKNLVSLMRVGEVTINGKVTNSVPLYGALCTGTYSYVWNSGYYFGEEGRSIKVPKAELRYNGNKKTDFRLVKIMDKTRAVCWKTLEGGGNSVRYEYEENDLTNVFVTEENDQFDEPIELLANTESANNDSALALYDLQVSAPAESNANNSLFYYATFILGTTSGGVNIMSSGDFCATPDDYKNEKFDYCAINKFNFAVQATGE